MKGPDNFSQLAVMGNICADLLAGAKTWERCGDWRELLSVRFRKALTPERLRGKTFRLSQVTGRPWCGTGGTDNTFSSDPTWQGRPDRGPQNVFPEQDRTGAVARIHISGMWLFLFFSFFFFSKLSVLCHIYEKLHITHFSNLFSLSKERQKDKKGNHVVQSEARRHAGELTYHWLAALILGIELLNASGS